jgi:hypothetical protein
LPQKQVEVQLMRVGEFWPGVHGFNLLFKCHSLRQGPVAMTSEASVNEVLSEWGYKAFLARLAA